MQAGLWDFARWHQIVVISPRPSSRRPASHLLVSKTKGPRPSWAPV